MKEYDDKWPSGIQFSMAPFGYTVTVTRKPTGYQGTIKYECRADRCQEDFYFKSYESVESATRKMRTHVDAKH